MSDRVANIGGSTSGWDHFPFPVPDAVSNLVDTGDGSEYPFGLSLADALWFYYVCRTPAFSGTIPIDVGSSNFGPVNGAAGGGVGFDWDTRRPGYYDYSGNTRVVSGQYTSEIETVLGRGWSISSDLIRRFSGPDSAYICDAVFATGDFSEYDHPSPFVYKEGLFYPNIIIHSSTGQTSDNPELDGDGNPTGWWIIDLDHGGEDGRSSRFGPRPLEGEPGGKRVGTVTVTIRGTDYTFGFYEPTGSGVTNDWIFSLNVVSPFWAFALRDGTTPVWNTSSGTQLNDPIESGVEYETIAQNHASFANNLNVLTDSAPWIPV